MVEWRLEGRYVLEGEIEAVTGLHIGCSQESVDIGGVDAFVVRVEWFPASLVPGGVEGDAKVRSRVPYLPGSSLRGKMRALLEWLEGKVAPAPGQQLPTGAHQCPKVEDALSCPICRVFGIPAQMEPQWVALGPTRLRVEDAYPTSETLAELGRYYGETVYTEVKYENFLNRLTSAAKPRQIERVPAGAQFTVRMVYDVYKPEDHQYLYDSVLVAMSLLEDSALGGHGSRGYGRVKFRALQLTWRSRDYYVSGGEPEVRAEACSLAEFAAQVKEVVSQVAGQEAGAGAAD